MTPFLLSLVPFLLPISVPLAGQQDFTRVDTVAIAALAQDLSSDAMRGRGAWTPENETVARLLAGHLRRLGARPLIGNDLLVPFVGEPRPRDTVYNVIAVFPAGDGTVSGELIGITAHFDHLGVGDADSSGDTIYNGFLDAAVPIAMVMDVARRYAESPGDRPLVVFYFNLEEEGLLGVEAFLRHREARAILARLQMLVGVDAGAPAGEAVEWQMMGPVPDHAGGRLADSLAHARGWTVTPSPPRPISDVYPFAQIGVPVLFPIPGKRWKGYTPEERNATMKRFDHYHRPSDQWRSDFPWIGTAAYADWLWEIVRGAGDQRRSLR